MIKLLKVKILLILLVILSSCEIKKSSEDDTGYFFDVVYQTVATRANTSQNWVPVSGIMQMKFVQQTDDQGIFQFYYSSYKEPQFAYPNPTSVCSGGFLGNFFAGRTSGNPDPEGNYDIMNPYNPNNSSPVAETPLDPNDPNAIAKIETYQFFLEITGRNLEAECRNETDRDVVLYRFKNGEVILKSEYRELRMKPVLIEENKEI